MYFDEYLEYVVDFKAEQFYLLGQKGEQISVIPFDTDLGFEMLKAFALSVMNREK